MEVTAELRKPPAQEWIAAMQETNTLIGAVASLINPETFIAGVGSIKAIGKDNQIVKREKLADLLNKIRSTQPKACLNRRLSRARQSLRDGLSFGPRIRPGRMPRWEQGR